MGRSRERGEPLSMLGEANGMIETGGMYHIHLIVCDLERAVRFYQDVLGLDATFRFGPDMVFLSTPGKGDVLTLHEDRENKARAGDNGGISHFGFRMKNHTQLDQAIEEVVRGGGTFVERGEHAPGIHYAYVTDPDGYVIELAGVGPPDEL